MYMCVYGYGIYGAYGAYMYLRTTLGRYVKLRERERVFIPNPRLN